MLKTNKVNYSKNSYDYLADDFCNKCENRLVVIVDWNNGDEYNKCLFCGRK